MALWAAITWGSVLLLVLALICFLLFCGYVQYIHMKYDHIPGPPRDSFLFGHAPTLMKIVNKKELIYDRFVEWAQTYGPILRINRFHNVVVLVLTPEGIKEFLMSPKYTKGQVYKPFSELFGVRFMGNGLLTDRDYDHWHKQRRIMDPAFSRTYLRGLMGTFNEKAEGLMEKLAEKADGKSEIVIHDLMSRVTLDVIAKVAFGMELNSLHDDQTPFPRAISLTLQGVKESRNPFLQYIPGKRTFVRNVKESIRLLRQTGTECIERRQKMIQGKKEIPTDILTQILKGADLEDNYDLEALLDNFVTFFIAGQETTANQLSFAVLELARHPEILEKVQAEVDDVIGSKTNIEYDDLGNLPYLSQILKETLRLYPTAPGTSRELTEEVVIEGVRIPPGVTLGLNSYVMGRMETFYKDPLTFDPERFSPDAPKPYFTYFPFSLGPRSCVGQVFAQMEAKVVMTKLLQRFEFQLVEGQSFKILDTGTLRPMDGVICRIKPRRVNK
ncbi:cholesterol 24-hydroxylase [Bombina bombina]|uniref:cholesterol 24-hydroxylase n=1 Tax=Bombina bombina TaxID=8345 RepID=UPI00235ABE90|nr:cholesterol 24-hydroxylase [Bombina bombina]